MPGIIDCHIHADGGNEVALPQFPLNNSRLTSPVVVQFAMQLSMGRFPALRIPERSCEEIAQIAVRVTV